MLEVEIIRVVAVADTSPMRYNLLLNCLFKTGILSHLVVVVVVVVVVDSD